MNASNPDIPAKVFEDPRSGSLIQQRVVLMMSSVNFEWLKDKTEGDAEGNMFSGTLTPCMMAAKHQHLYLRRALSTYRVIHMVVFHYILLTRSLRVAL